MWVPEVPSNIEEKSGIDNESYVIVSEEHVVDGVATFMARCILANPNALVYNPILLDYFALCYWLMTAFILISQCYCCCQCRI